MEIKQKSSFLAILGLLDEFLCEREWIGFS